MNRSLAMVLVVLFVAAMVALIAPMWVATAGMGLPAAGWGAVIGTIVFCFLVGGGLMFLIFYSARHGYDEAGQMHAHRDRSAPNSSSEKP